MTLGLNGYDRPSPKHFIRRDLRELPRSNWCQRFWKGQEVVSQEPTPQKKTKKPHGCRTYTTGFFEAWKKHPASPSLPKLAARPSRLFFQEALRWELTFHDSVTSTAESSPVTSSRTKGFSVVVQRPSKTWSSVKTSRKPKNTQKIPMFQSTNVRCISNLRFFDLLKLNERIDSTHLCMMINCFQNTEAVWKIWTKLAELKGVWRFSPFLSRLSQCWRLVGWATHWKNMRQPSKDVSNLLREEVLSENRSDLKPPAPFFPFCLRSNWVRFHHLQFVSSHLIVETGGLVAFFACS